MKRVNACVYYEQGFKQWVLGFVLEEFGGVFRESGTVLRESVKGC
jgi:hypothetical protein